MVKKPTLADLQQQIAELTEALQRERADSLNMRRRAEEQNASMATLYKKMVIEHFLPAIDNLERAIKHAPKDLADHDYVKGIQGVVKQFDHVFNQLGIERIKSVGEHFDPHLHEAVHVEEGDGKHEIITEELQPGYKIGDEVIRHAMVKVKRGKA